MVLVLQMRVLCTCALAGDGVSVANESTLYMCSSWVSAKAGLWTLDWTMDWTMDWNMDSILDSFSSF